MGTMVTGAGVGVGVVGAGVGVGVGVGTGVGTGAMKTPEATTPVINILLSAHISDTQIVKIDNNDIGPFHLPVYGTKKR